MTKGLGREQASILDARCSQQQAYSLLSRTAVENHALGQFLKALLCIRGQQPRTTGKAGQDRKALLALLQVAGNRLKHDVCVVGMVLSMCTMALMGV